MAERNSPSGSGFLRRWLPMLLLSILPLLLLLWQAREEDRRIAADADQSWLTATDAVARHMGQASRPSFWLESAARRFRLWTERDLRRGRGFGTAAERGLSEASLSGLPGLQAWVVEFPGGALDQPGKSLAGGRLATTSRRLVAGLLQEAARSKMGGSGSPSRAAVEGLFGVGTSPELFTAGGRGIAFHVLFGRQSGLAIWDVIEIGPHCRGAFLLLMPIQAGDRKIAIRATLANWHRMVRKGGLVPAFMPLPAKPGPVRGRILSLPGGRGRAVVKALEGWRNRPQIQGGAGLDLERLRPLLSESLRMDPAVIGTKITGRLRLGGYRAGVVERLPGTGLKVRVVFLDPLTCRIGLLMAPDRRLDATWQKRAVFAWAGMVGLAWAAAVLLPMMGIRLGASGVRRELSAWFLALAAIPLTLTAAAAWKYQSDLQTNLTEGLRDELIQEFAGLEVGGDRLNDRYQQVCHEVSSRSDLVPRLRAIYAGAASETGLMASLMADCRRRGADPIGILIIGRNGSVYSRFLKSVPLAQQEMFTLVFEVLGRSQFGWESGKYAPTIPGKGRKGRSVMLGQAMSRMAELRSDDTKWNQADARSQMTTGGKSTFNYHRLLYDGTQQIGGIIFLWDEDRMRRRFLAREVPQVAKRRGITIAAFRRQENGFAMVAAGGQGHLRESLRQLARQARESTILVSRGDAVMVAAPNQRMPQFVLAAAISKEKILLRLALESRRILGLVGGLVALILVAVWGLATWLVHPLQVMDRGLRKVAAGDLRLRLEINRNDELGDAGATLDRMTNWLRERQRMSRFVAPQVLEAVAAGGIESTGQGQIKRLVVLVSDIRSFTGISEAQSPEAVFDLLNRHLERMTQVIKGCDGTIDRFIGDAIQAVFFEGGPEPAERRALKAAREMMREHAQLNRERASAGSFPYGIGIGIAAGPMVAGIVGDPAHRLDFTVLGEALREAGELEASSKAGCRSLIICSQEVREVLSPAHRFLPVVGFADAWELDETIGSEDPGERNIPVAERHTAGLHELPGSAPVHGGGGRGTAWREPLPSWFFHLVFWLLPVLVVIGAIRLLELSRRENTERQILEKTHQAAELINQNLDPASQVANYLNGELRDGLSEAFQDRRAPASGVREVSDVALTRAIVPRLRRLETFFGRFRWSLFGHAPEKDRMLDGTSRKSTRLLARGGEPSVPPMSRVDAERIFTLYKSYAVGGCPGPHLLRFEAGSLTSWIGGNALQMAVTMQRSCETLVRQATSNELRYSYWSPFLASDVIELRLPDDLKRTTIGPSFELWDGMQGGVLIDIGSECLTPDRVMRSMIRQYRRDGFFLAFLGKTGGSGPQRGVRDPVFGRDPELQSFLHSSDRTRIGSRWIAVRGYFAKEFGGEFILACPLPSAFSGAGPLPGSKWHWILGMWLIGGLALTVFRFWGGTMRFPLAYRLIGAFTAVLLPVLLVGGLTLERSGLERQGRIEREIPRRLDLLLKGIDEEHILYHAQQCAILTDLARDTEFLAALGDDEENRRWPVFKRESGKWMTIQPTTASRPFEAFPPIPAAYWNLIGRGVNPNSVVVSGIDEYVRYYPIALQKEEENITLYLFRDLFTQGLQRLGAGGNDGPGAGNSDRQRRQLLAGAKFEELRDLFSLLFPPAAFAEITGSPEAFIEMLLGEVKHSLYRSFLPKRGSPAFAFQTVWNPKSLIWQHLNDREEWRPQGTSGQNALEEVRLIAMVPRDEPVFHHPAPYGVPLFQPVTGDCALKRQNTLLPAGMRRLTKNAATALMPVGKRMYPPGSGDEGDLIRVRIGDRIDRHLLVGFSPLGRILQANRLQMERERMVLVGLLLLTIILARAAAHRLLEPIRALTDGAGKIMEGDFRIRLQIEREDELGRLATAFNGMARGVEEGERLSRFVSDSVREAVRNEEREQAALEGVSCEAAVLFAGLPQFKDHLARRDPVGLISDLNRHLQQLAGQVRAAGGEIDKFIGDRILAVFHVSRFGSRESAVRAALDAADGMRIAALAADAPFRQPLGVGVVYGTVLAGIMGTETVRLEYTVIGDTVNLASRLCDLAGSLPGGGIVLDSQMAQSASAHGTIAPIDVRRVKGKSREVEVFCFERSVVPAPDRGPNGRSGFTLIELVMVLALLTVLATLSLPMVEVVDRRAREGMLREALRETRQGIAAYREARASAAIMLPLTLGALTETIPEGMLASWANRGPFLAEVPRNPFQGAVDGSCYWYLRDGGGAWTLVTSATTVLASGIFDIRFALPPDFPWGARALDGSYYTEW